MHYCNCTSADLDLDLAKILNAGYSAYYYEYINRSNFRTIGVKDLGSNKAFDFTHTLRFHK
eukprot:COSAG05_NODE_13430_length_430_cov_1.643505_1_plen_60_part_10